MFCKSANWLAMVKTPISRKSTPMYLGGRCTAYEIALYMTMKAFE